MNKTNLIFAAALCAGSLTLCGYETYNEAYKAGNKAYAEKNYEKMRADFAEAKTLAQNNNQEWNAIFYETRACREMKKYDDAIVILDKFLAKKPVSNHKASALFIKGLVLSAQGKNTEAVKMYEAAVEIPAIPGYQREQAYSQMMGIYFSSKQYDKCEETANKLLAIPKTSYIADSYYYLGQSAFAKEKYADAEKAYLASLKAASNKNRILYANYQLAYTYLKLNKKEEAVKYFEATVKASPKSWRGQDAAKQLKKYKK